MVRANGRRASSGSRATANVATHVGSHTAARDQDVLRHGSAPLPVRLRRPRMDWCRVLRTSATTSRWAGASVATNAASRTEAVAGHRVADASLQALLAVVRDRRAVRSTHKAEDVMVEAVRRASGKVALLPVVHLRVLLVLKLERSVAQAKVRAGCSSRGTAPTVRLAASRTRSRASHEVPIDLVDLVVNRTVVSLRRFISQ